MDRKFCTNCGHQLDQDAVFCPECGTSLETAAAAESTTTSIPVRPSTPKVAAKPAQPKKPMSLVKKATIIGSLVVAVALLGTHLTLKSITGPEKKIEAFYNALINEDEDKFFSELNLPKDVTYESKSYLAFIKDQNMPMFLNELQENASSVAKDGLTRIVEHEYGDELFRLKQKKTLGIYKSIIIEPITTLVKIETDLTEGKLVVADKEFSFEGKDMNLGKFLPGPFKAVVESKNAYIPNKNEWIIYISTDERERVHIFLKEDHMIELEGEFGDSIVYIDGVSTEKTIDEIKEIGPIFDNREVHFYASKKTVAGEWAESYSDSAYPGGYVYLSFPYPDDFIEKTPEQIAEENFDRDDLTYFIQSFRSSYEYALNYQDFSYINYYLMDGSPVYDELSKYINELEDADYYYEFTQDQVTDISLSPEEAIISTNEKFIFTNHEGEVTHYDRNKEYTVKLDGNEYKIYSIKILDTNTEDGGN